jgi:hypothetical protein
MRSDQIYRIRNLNTGEEIDLREESRDDFVPRLAKLLQKTEEVEELDHF